MSEEFERALRALTIRKATAEAETAELVRDKAAIERDNGRNK